MQVIKIDLRESAMEEGKPHPTATGVATSSQDAAEHVVHEFMLPPPPPDGQDYDAFAADDEAFAHDLYMSQLMELYGDDETWSAFTAGPERPGGARAGDPFDLNIQVGSFLSDGAGSSVQRDVAGDDATPFPTRSGRRIEPVERYVPPPARSGAQAFLRLPLTLGGAAAAYSTRPPATVSISHVGGTGTTPAVLLQALPAVAPATMPYSIADSGGPPRRRKTCVGSCRTYGGSCRPGRRRTGSLWHAIPHACCW
ncbi:hypothetical protein E2562_008214 [Oryza meyeriana var. granulata]|uniref:Uncharacterized protein n=1 Tax=Oryza meyeriana var. granulata TaxID=110450 RepID=A0A6G1DES7_9ORYZ|nr:hypothetical protein E2562_008214 [Oryza meyeriana var. granulata]